MTTSVRSAHFALALLFVVALFNYADRYVIAILLPHMRQDFQLSDTQMGFLSGLAFTLFYVLMGIPIARLADQYSRKKILVISLSLWSLMTAACGLAQNFIQLAVARMLVGIAEAGSSPPSYSLISDLYPAGRRAAAMSVYLCGAPGGILIGFILGGWLAQEFGWRTALVAVGLPGAVFALFLAWLLKEPPRGGADGLAQESTQVQPFTKGLIDLLSNPAFRHAALGCAFYNALIVAYVNWMPSFFIRSHDLGLQDTGFVLALIFGPSQLVGLVAGGFISDRLSRSDIRWYVRVPAAAVLVAMPLFMLSMTLTSTWLALLFLFVPLLIGGAQTPPAFALTQSLVEVRMRAVASAVLILIINLLSGALGPLVVGFVSDLFASAYGEQSLRYSLLWITPALSLWAAVHYFLASRHLRGGIGQPQFAAR